jgi:hypothetical protein
MTLTGIAVDQERVISLRYQFGGHEEKAADPRGDAR